MRYNPEYVIVLAGKVRHFSGFYADLMRGELRSFHQTEGLPSSSKGLLYCWKKGTPDNRQSKPPIRGSGLVVWGFQPLVHAHGKTRKTTRPQPPHHQWEKNKPEKKTNKQQLQTFKSRSFQLRLGRHRCPFWLVWLKNGGLWFRWSFCPIYQGHLLATYGRSSLLVPRHQFAVAFVARPGRLRRGASRLQLASPHHSAGLGRTLN